jgi:hypothetical protein
MGSTKCLAEVGMLTIWPTYVVEKRTTLGKAYGMKVWCNWEPIGKHFGNLKIHVDN